MRRILTALVPVFLQEHKFFPVVSDFPLQATSLILPGHGSLPDQKINLTNKKTIIRQLCKYRSMRGAVAKRLECLTPCLCRTLNSPLSRITTGVRSKPLSNYFALYFIIPPPWCFLLSLLSFFFVSYNVFVRFHTARNSAVLLNLKPVSFTLAQFSVRKSSSTQKLFAIVIRHNQCKYFTLVSFVFKFFISVNLTFIYAFCLNQLVCVSSVNKVLS